MRNRIRIACLACLSLALLAACGQQSKHDPAQGEMQALVDLALDVTDLVCPAVEETKAFKKRAANPIYRVNPGGESISLTTAGLDQAARMALGAVETGMCFPDLQREVEARMPHDEVERARSAAGTEFERLGRDRARYSDRGRALLDSYSAILETVDEITELASQPGRNPSFYLQYGVARALYMRQLELFTAAVEEMGDGKAAGPCYLASRERYLQAAGDFMLSPASDLLKGSDGP